MDSECGKYWFLIDFCHWKFKLIPKNQVLEGKISWGCVNTWANDTGHTPSLISMISIYAGRLFVCFVLYFTYVIHRTEMLQITFLVFEKLLRRRGELAWFHGICTCGVEVLGYWITSSLKIKLNSSWKFQKNWNVALVLLERSWWAQFNGIYLVRSGFRMWEILILKGILLLKFQKTRFWKEKSVENLLTQATLVYLWRKVCFVVRRSTKLGCFKSCSWCVWKALDEEGCIGLVPWLLNLQCKSSWILNDFFIKLNCSWKF